MIRFMCIVAIFASLGWRALGSGVLRPHPINSRYFTDDTGAVIYLTGSHNWFNVHKTAAVNYDFGADLAANVAQGHNFMRGWQLDEPQCDERFFAANSLDGDLTPFPWARTGPGNAADGGRKFDLSVFNQTYFDTLRAHVIEAGDAGVYFSVMLTSGYFVDSSSSGIWANCQYNAANNVNGVLSSIDDVYTLNDSTWVALMYAYADKVVDTVNDLDNVLYEISCEGPVQSIAWQYDLIDHIHTYEAGKAKQHPVGMTMLFAAAQPNTVLTDPACHADWVSFAHHRPDNYKTDVPDAPGGKVSILDTDHIWGATDAGADGAPWVWRSLTRGHNPIYMDPLNQIAGLASDADIRASMGYARAVADTCDLAHMIPSDASASTRYCLAYTGHEYLVYQPAKTSFTVALAANSYRATWIKPEDGNTLDGGVVTLATAGNQTFALPAGFSSGVLHLKTAAGRTAVLSSP